MGREALDRERPRHTDLLFVFVGLVVQVLALGLGSDRGVDLPLPRDPRGPPVGMEFIGLGRPVSVSPSGNLPLFPLLLHGFVERLAKRLHRRLPLVVDDVDLGVVGDALERDVWHALVHEAETDVAVRRLRGRRRCGHLRFFILALAGVGEQVVGVAGAHYASACEGQRYARGVDRDPATAPLLGDVGGRA